MINKEFRQFHTPAASSRLRNLHEMKQNGLLRAAAAKAGMPEGSSKCYLSDMP